MILRKSDENSTAGCGNSSATYVLSQNSDRRLSCALWSQSNAGQGICSAQDRVEGLCPPSSSQVHVATRHRSPPFLPCAWKKPSSQTLLAVLILLAVETAPSSGQSAPPTFACYPPHLHHRVSPICRHLVRHCGPSRPIRWSSMRIDWFSGPKIAEPVPRKGALSSLVLDPVRRAVELFPNSKGVIDQVWTMLPLALRALINPSDLFLFVTTRLLYRKACRALHAFHHFLWKRAGIMDEPRVYEDSVLGFMEPKLGTLTSFIGVTYVINVVLSLLIDIGWRVRADSARLMASLLYIAYGAYFVNEVKKEYLTTWVPSLQEDRRRSYIIDRSSSVVLWILAIFSCIECISAFLKIPLSSTLAFGGIGGLAFGLASKDVVSNFFGGVMLLFTEPFTPGDMVSFTTRGTHYEGKVERVGFYQTRLRGRDTRPTYVPNSVFVDTMVTNMDRITHRRFEASFSLRFQDFETLPEVILEIKKALRVLPKVDVLSPFRVHFTQFGSYCLSLTASCYFATKSLDEYLYLQQLALMEITRVVTECGCRFAYPTTHLDLVSKELGQSLITGVVDYQNELEQVAASGGGGGDRGSNTNNADSMKGAGQQGDFSVGFNVPPNPINPLNSGGGNSVPGPGEDNSGSPGPRPTRGVRVMQNMRADDDNVMTTSVMPSPPFPPPPPPSSTQHSSQSSSVPENSSRGPFPPPVSAASPSGPYADLSQDAVVA